MPANMRITAFVLLIRDLPIPHHNITNSPKVICHSSGHGVTRSVL